MYKPTEEELLEMGFDLYAISGFWEILIKENCWINYYISRNSFDIILGEQYEEIFPESKQDIKTLIRLFKLS